MSEVGFGNGITYVHCFNAPLAISGLDLRQITFAYLQLSSFFKMDLGKVETWLLTKNPLLGDVEPVAMIFNGRGDKLLKFIETQLADGEVVPIVAAENKNYEKP